MKKKLLAMMLMVVMVLSLAACGTKNTASGDGVKAVLDKMSALETNGVSMVFEMNMDDENVGIKLDMSGDDDTALVTFDVKMNIEGMVLDDYVRLTDVIVVDQVAYANVTSIFDFLAELDPQYALLSAYIDLPGDYLMLTMDDLSELYQDFLGVDIDFAELLNTSLEETEEENPALAEAAKDVVCRFIDEFAAKEGSGVTVSGDKISVSVNEKTIEAFMKALASMDVEDYCMQYAEAMDKIEGGVDYTAAMSKEIDGLNEAIREASEDVSFDDDEQIEINASMGVQGKNNVVSASIRVKDSLDDVKMSLSVKTTPDKNQSISVPGSIMTYDEFMEAFGY